MPLLSDPLIAALLAVFVAFLGQWGLDKVRQREKVQNFLRGIYEELREIYNQLNSLSKEESWKRFEKGEESYYDKSIQISPDYSIIYRSEANLVGQIKSPDLRRGIVKTYKALDVLREIHKMNNRLLLQLKKPMIERVIESRTTNVTILSLATEFEEIAPELLETHNFSKKSIKEVLDLLEKELSKPNERFWEQQ